MKNWRPDGWPKCPCDECDRKVVDGYGYFCNLACGERTTWFNREAGADAMYEAIWKMARESPTGTFAFGTNAINVFEGAKE